MQRINEVITKLDEIIHEAKIAQSPLGYFAPIYRQMTIAIRDGILNGTFENGSRMEQLDVRFAGRYFAALEAWQQGKPCSASWQKAFDAAKENRLTVLQHILLGINAHINLDLSIATAETRPGEAVLGLRDDFNKVNDIIAALTNQVQDNLANIWLPFRWLDFL